MKKLICVLLVIFAALLLLASCSNTDDAEVTTGADEVTKSPDDGVNFTPITKDTETERETEEVTTEIGTETDEVVTPVTPVTTDAPETSAPQPPVYRTGSYANDPLISRMVFLGDSTTYGLKYYGIVDDSQVWTPKNGTLAIFRATTDYIVDPATGGEMTVSDMCAKYKPDILVITLGVNGISFMEEDSFKSCYNDLLAVIKAASPTTKIAIQTMYPLAASYDTSSGINNTKISNGNNWIRDIAASAGVACIDSAPSLVDSTGYRPEAWHNGDGLHLSSEGFAAVMNYIINHPCY